MPRKDLSEKYLDYETKTTYQKLKKKKRLQPAAFTEEDEKLLQRLSGSESRDLQINSVSVTVKYPTAWNEELRELGRLFARLNRSDIAKKRTAKGSLPEPKGSPAEAFREAFLFFVNSGAAEKFAKDQGEEKLAEAIRKLKATLKRPKI